MSGRIKVFCTIKEGNGTEVWEQELSEEHAKRLLKISSIWKVRKQAPQVSESSKANK